MNTTESLILLNMIEGLGIVRLRALLKIYDSPQEILNNPSEGKLKTAEGIGDVIAQTIVDMARHKDERLKRELCLIEKNRVGVISVFDDDYPASLKSTYDPPMLLYVKGNLLPDDILALAIVGSRRATYYGLSTTERLAGHLAARGITIVSGLARGVDSAAHKGALKVKGRTMAVLGSGLGVIYPPENRGLYEKIIESGAVVSELPYQTIPDRKNFPRRNRVISGLSLGVVVVEAAQHSGSLITANMALEHGREVFAVPGKVDSLSSAGTNNLIKQGAKLVQTADDILEELKPILGKYLETLEEQKFTKAGIRPEQSLGPGEQEALADKFSADTRPKSTPQKSSHQKSGIRKSSLGLRPAGLNQEEQRVYNLLSSEPVYIDDITQETSLPASRVSGILIRLELKKLARQLPGKMFVRV